MRAKAKRPMQGWVALGAGLLPLAFPAAKAQRVLTIAGGGMTTHRLRSLQSPVNTEWGALMTGSAIATLPLVVLFVLSSRQLISGLTAGAVK